MSLEGIILSRTLESLFLSYGIGLEFHVAPSLPVACHGLMSYIKELKETEEPTCNLEECFWSLFKGIISQESCYF